MTFHTGVGWSNPLVRRVMRHYSISVLYRLASPTTFQSVAREFSVPPAPLPDDEPIVAAYLVAPDTQTPLEVPPVVHTVPPSTRAATTPPTPPRTLPQAPALREVAGPPPPATPETQTMAAPRTQPQEEATTVAEQAVTAGGQTETTLTDDVWHRLQTIFRRHQEKAAASGTETRQTTPATGQEVAAQEPVPQGTKPLSASHQALPKREENEVPAASSTQPIEPTESVDIPPSHIAVTDTAAGAIAGEPDIRSKQQTIPTAHRETIERDTDERRRDDGIVIEDGVKSVLSSETELPRQATPTSNRGTTDRNVDGRRRAPAATPADRAGSIQVDERELPRQPSPPSPSAEVPLSIPTAGDLSQPQMEHPKAMPAPLAPHPAQAPVIQRSPDTTSLEPQPAPLHEVWHVERILPEAPATAPTPPTFSAPSTQEVRPQSQPAIEEILGNIAAAGFTRSSVEILPPRRPRPRGLSPEPSAAPAQNATQARVAVRPTSVERTSDASPSVAAARTSAEPAPAPQQLVETEIGPLPSDLWHLIGESPPVPRVSKPVGSPAPSPPPPTSHGEHIESPPASLSGTWAQPASPEAAPSEKATGGTPGETNVIRRTPDETAQAETATVTEQATSTAQTPNAQSEGTQQQEEASPEEALDIEALARRVYSEIRRRIHTELERARQR